MTEIEMPMATTASQRTVDSDATVELSVPLEPNIPPHQRIEAVSDLEPKYERWTTKLMIQFSSWFDRFGDGGECSSIHVRPSKVSFDLSNLLIRITTDWCK